MGGRGRLLEGLPPFDESFPCEFTHRWSFQGFRKDKNRLLFEAYANCRKEFHDAVNRHGILGIAGFCVEGFHISAVMLFFQLGEEAVSYLETGRTPSSAPDQLRMALSK